MAAFSRLQLAAALLEYDNDPSNPDAPKRSAHESAIFAHLRRTSGPRRAKRDYLGVSVPSESGSLGGHEGRRSRASTVALRNPFTADESVDGDEDEEEEENMEVDLASWGLDSFIPKEKGSSSSRKKEKSVAFPNPHPVKSLRRRPDPDVEILQRPTHSGRSMSLGYNNSFGAGGAFLDAPSSAPAGASLNMGQADTLPRQRQRAASFHGLLAQPPTTQPVQSVPFPTFSPRSNSPDQAIHGMRPQRRYSDLDTRLRPHDPISSSSHVIEEPRNPFAIKAPSPERASRFDPKASHARALSSASILEEDDYRPSSRASRVDLGMSAHARTVSNASMGSRMLLDNDAGSVMTGQRPYVQERPYSTLELMRPKILVMPSPLQSIAEATPPPLVTGRDGFELSVDPPLPPGARTTPRASTAFAATDPSSSLGAPIASNSFTPNPRTSLTLSQLTFRNNLMVGGERDVAYTDLEGALIRATVDGEQIRSQSPVEELPEPTPVVKDEHKRGRPAGKLFGKSLIDDLEQRKAQLHKKQRVFTGDQRPSMMARTNRTSTLIDPATLHARPTSQRVNSQGIEQPIGRRSSLNIKPLLNFDSEVQSPTTNLPADTRMVSTRSVFGVDTLWEREIAKLKEIEAQERREAEEMERQEQAKEAKKAKRRAKGKGKSKDQPIEQQTPDLPLSESAADLTRVSIEPPILPKIQKASSRRPPPPDDYDESDGSVDSAEIQPSARDAEAERWVAESSDEEPRRTTGIGPRRSNAARARLDDDSEEDLPLSIAVERAAKRIIARVPSNDSSDEEKPLSVLLQKTKLSLPSASSNRSLGSKQEADDDDDQPLGLRASRVLSSSRAFSGLSEQNEDDDDRPLAYHPEHQRRTQYQMLAQHQHMMMQAQLHNSMFFGPPAGMMGPSFFAPPMAAPLMMAPPPMPMPSPPPLQDPAKFGRVDRWRRDVVVEGKP